MPIVMVLAMILILPGCLTVEQRAKMNELQAQMVNAANTLEELKPVAEKLKTLLQEITAEFKAGKMPLEKFLELSRLYQEQQAAVVAKIASLQNDYKAAEQQIKDLNAQGVPWYEILFGILLAGYGIYQRRQTSIAGQTNGVLMQAIETGDNPATKAAVTNISANLPAVKAAINTALLEKGFIHGSTDA